MNAQQKENLQIALLRSLSSNHTRFGLNVEALQTFAASFGFPGIPAEEIEGQIEYLKEKGLVEEPMKVISKANRAFKISAKGREFLDERGF